MGSPEFMAAWDEMCVKCAEHDAMTAAGVVVGEDGAVRWHGLTGAEIEGLKETVKRLERKYAVLETMPWLGRVTGVGGEPKPGEHIARIRFRDAATAGRGADGEAT